MAKRSKRMQAIYQKIDRNRIYNVEEALKLLKELAQSEETGVKFGQSVDVAVNLGVDPRKSDQVVRGATVLPHGTGKKVKVAVFADGEAAEAAREAGADVVGMEDLAEEIKKGSLDFDVVIATPEAMRIVSRLGPILGPKGLMPNPKMGTVTSDVAAAVKNAKKGQVRYRVDKAGIIHCTIGKTSFDVEALKENLKTLLGDLQRAKPPASKGVYMKRVILSTTMGPGLVIDHSELVS